MFLYLGTVSQAVPAAMSQVVWRHIRTRLYRGCVHLCGYLGFVKSPVWSSSHVAAVVSNYYDHIKFDTDMTFETLVLVLVTAV